MIEYSKPKDPLKSWNCKGCTNTVQRNGNTYCRPMIEGRHRKEWHGATIVCLDKEVQNDKE